MIPARKTPRFSAWFTGQAVKRLQRTFAAVRVRGVESLAAALGPGPVILVSNHTSWWDPLVCLLVANRLVQSDAYAMMDAANLRRLPFFARVGAFGVDRSEAGLAGESLDYAAALLDRPGRLLWIFAQGDERPINQRPLGFRRGAAVVWERVPEARVVPLAIRYVFAEREQPYLYLAFGPALPSGEGIEARRVAMERAVEAQLDTIERALAAPDASFVERLRARPRRLERLAERALAWLNRRRRREIPHARPPD
ncbi:MAG: 1-acyl-sn-glycerol-3-phosphate acyltransferase [bacterium]